MYLNRRPNQSSTRGMAALALALMLGAVADPPALRAQVPPFPTPLPACVVPDSPDNDTWPKALTRSIGSTAGEPVIFPGTDLLGADVGAGVTVLSVGPDSIGGGTITGTDPYTYMPGSAFGADSFPYEIIQIVVTEHGTETRTSMGIVKVSVTADGVAPAVSITSPLGGQVSNNVAVRASASDNVGVTSVSFFDGATQIGGDDTASPFETVWNTIGLAEGDHSLTAVARDAAGHATTSAPVVVNVHNIASVNVPSVVGLSEAAAVSAIGGAGLVADVTSANSTFAAIGTIAEQTPAGGTSVASGSHVAVVVSLGAKVPDVVGSTQTTATPVIISAGLVLGTVNSANSAAPINTIISQTPTAGSNVAPGTVMTITVSLGPAAPANVTVPNVVGMTQTAASSAITTAGLTVGGITTQSSATVPAGSVISQNPTGGSSAAPGSAVALVVSSGAPVTPPATGGLVLALGFEEASGNVVADSSAAPMNGTLAAGTSAPTRVAAGKYGRALSFDGGDAVGIADVTASKLDLINGMTLEAWVNPSSMNGWESVLYKERGGAGTGVLSYALYAHDGGTSTPPAGYVRTSSAGPDRGIQGGTARLPLNAWSHIAVTYSTAAGVGSTLRFYVDGALVNTITGPNQNILQANQPLRIGNSNAPISEGFNGLIDEVRVYNRALSGAEIAADMNTPVVP
jgi:beta-lactam-binding protein with PASTA domain